MKKPTQSFTKSTAQLRLLFFLLAALFSSKTVHAQTQENILLAKIWLNGQTVQDLENAGLEIDHGIYEPGQYFQSEFSAKELRKVKAAGFDIDTLEADVVARYLRENAFQKPVRTPVKTTQRGESPCDAFGPSVGTPINYTYGSMGGYYTYEEYLAILDDMHAKYPNLISERQVVHPSLLTHEGRPQWFVRISDHPETDESSEAEVLYTALHHAREPNSLTHLIYYMWHLLENYDQDPELRYLLDHTELYFIPCLNPDGYIYNQTTNPNGGGFWRKNRRDNGDGTFGVDLNRNYGYNWGGNFNGSSGITSSETYRGPSEFSEPETQMAKAFIESHDFKIILNCHTSGNKMVHPWGYENSIPTPDFSTLAEWLTRESNYPHGSCFQTLNYFSNGTSDDWAYGALDKFAFTPETGTSFWPTIDKIEGNNQGMFLTNYSAAWFALGGAVIRHLPGESIIGNTLTLPFKVSQNDLGAAIINIDFEALTPNIDNFSTIAPIALTNFETNTFNVVLQLNSNIQTGENIRFVAKATRNGQIHTDTVSLFFNPSPYQTLFSDNPDQPNAQWNAGAWGPTSEHAYSSAKSMTDSPLDVYTATENFLTTAAPISIPSNATEARLRFFTRWDIGPDLDWAQVLASTDGGNFFTPLEGRLTNLNPALSEPAYWGTHPNWEEECMDLEALIGQAFYLRFGMTAFSGNPAGRDGFYFDDLILEYRTASGVFTLNIPDDWKLQSQPNPAIDQTWVIWEQRFSAPGPLQLEICSAAGEPFRQISIASGSSNTYHIETANWPAGLYLYRLKNENGNSSWKKLVVLH